MSRAKPGVASVVAGALLAVLAACAPSPDINEVEFRIPVEVADVTTESVEDLIVTTGTLRAREVVTLNIETPGNLLVARDAGGRRLAEGSTVEAGQLVAEVTGEDARLAARIDATTRTLDTARAELERRRELFEAELIPEEELRQMEVALENALHDFERSKLTAAKARLTTPIGGVLLRLARDADDDVPLADGQLVTPGLELAQIAQLDEMIADIDLVGPELARVRPGLPTRIRHYAFEGIEIPGEVVRLSPTMDPDTHTFRAEVAVTNSQNLLRPGMFVEVTIIAERRADVPVVPRESVTERAGKNVVFLLDGQRVARRDVRLGLGDDDKVEVLEGLATGDRIVVRGLETLTDGTRVRVVSSQ
jgi:membrane fusion protein (multidrug efflux system)